MSAVYALYGSGNAAQRAVDSLRAAGYGDEEITVISGSPMEDYEFSHIGHRGIQWYAASIGGLIGLLLAVWMTVFAERDWPINVGNMPIVAWYPNLIVIFEMTRLGAILFNVGTLIVTAGLGRRVPKLYDPAVSSGKILVGIESPRDGNVADVERALLVAPGAEVKTV
jgi:hypothetical protein